jgi:dTDP-glucose pyrophosphorylase
MANEAELTAANDTYVEQKRKVTGELPHKHWIEMDVPLYNQLNQAEEFGLVERVQTMSDRRARLTPAGIKFLWLYLVYLRLNPT